MEILYWDMYLLFKVLQICAFSFYNVLIELLVDLCTKYLDNNIMKIVQRGWP